MVLGPPQTEWRICCRLALRRHVGASCGSDLRSTGRRGRAAPVSGRVVVGGRPRAWQQVLHRRLWGLWSTARCRGCIYHRVSRGMTRRRHLLLDAHQLAKQRGSRDDRLVAAHQFAEVAEAATHHYRTWVVTPRVADNKRFPVVIAICRRIEATWQHSPHIAGSPEQACWHTCNGEGRVRAGTRRSCTWGQSIHDRGEAAARTTTSTRHAAAVGGGLAGNGRHGSRSGTRGPTTTTGLRMTT